MDFIQTTFNNREIATALWLLTGLTFAIVKLKFYPNVWEILQVLLFSRLTLLFLVLAAWMSVGVWGLHWLGVWTLGDLKLTIFW